VFVRFLRFNVVGAIGVAVQIASLALLVSVLGLHYLPATAIAIELSVLHNFLWHERWTWRDRTGNARCSWPKAECAMPHARGALRDAGYRARRAGFSLTRLVKFHIGNGLVSMIGSLALMPVFVSVLGLHYIPANLATIAATGLFNFLLGDRVVFRVTRELEPAGRPTDG
jgi:putative flippase GtrA